VVKLNGEGLMEKKNSIRFSKIGTKQVIVILELVLLKL
tara:strand:- start:146 stop:259 length:114 start_codon:yes stop_codon:yes gene_type:complete